MSALSVIAAARARNKAHRARVYSEYESYYYAVSDGWLQLDKLQHKNRNLLRISNDFSVWANISNTWKTSSAFLKVL